MDGRIELPEKTVVITFDDGYLSNAIYAYPIMKQYDFKGTIFAIGSAVNKEQPIFEPSTIQFISTLEMPKYTDVFNFECHTYNLHRMDSSKKPMLGSSEKKTIINDLIINKNLLKANYFAYPYGYYNIKTPGYLKEVGYKMAFTTKDGYVTKISNRYKLPRFSVTPHNMPIEKFSEIVLGSWERQPFLNDCLCFITVLGIKY